MSGTAFYVMAHVVGWVFLDQALPGLAPADRTATYGAMNITLAGRFIQWIMRWRLAVL